MNETKQKDTLKELENLLEKDIKHGSPASDPQSARAYLSGVYIRVAVSLVLFIVAFLTGFIEHLNLIVLAVVILGLIEVYRYFSWKRKVASRPRFE